MSNKLESTIEKILATIFFAIVGLSSAIAELAIVFRAKDLSPKFVNYTMGVASFFWCVMAICLWDAVIRRKTKNLLEGLIIFTAIALVSVMGIFFPRLNSAARWIDAFFGVMMLWACIFTIWQGWKSGRFIEERFIHVRRVDNHPTFSEVEILGACDHQGCRENHFENDQKMLLVDEKLAQAIIDAKGFEEAVEKANPKQPLIPMKEESTKKLENRLREAYKEECHTGECRCITFEEHEENLKR